MGKKKIIISESCRYAAMTATCLVAKQRNFMESKGQFLKSSKTMLSHTGPVIQCQTHMRPSSKQTPSSWQLTLVLALIERDREREEREGEKEKQRRRLTL